MTFWIWLAIAFGVLDAVCLVAFARAISRAPTLPSGHPEFESWPPRELLDLSDVDWQWPERPAA